MKGQALMKTLCSFVVMASSTELSRKILNSPGQAEPAIVYSMKYILSADNW
jgi:C-22 sterol desaturase